MYKDAKESLKLPRVRKKMTRATKSYQDPQIANKSQQELPRDIEGYQEPILTLTNLYWISDDFRHAKEEFVA